MKRFIRVFAVASCVCLALVLMACSSGSGKSDSDKLSASDAKSPFYVLIIGNDSRKGTVEIDKAEYSDGKGRSDTMILARIDPIDYQITLVTVPRDTTTTLNGAQRKLNEVYNEKGVEVLVDEVSALTGAHIDYYLDMDFLEFEKFINELEGIQASVPIDMSLQDIASGAQINLKAGEQDLEGAEALVLARMRKAYANDHDASRQIQNRQIVEVGLKKVLADPAAAAASANILLDNMDTNWKSSELIDLIVDFVENSERVTILSGTGLYTGEVDPATDLWMIPRDEAAWKKLMKVVDAGGDPQSVIPLPPVSSDS